MVGLIGCRRRIVGTWRRRCGRGWRKARGSGSKPGWCWAGHGLWSGCVGICGATRASSRNCDGCRGDRVGSKWWRRWNGSRASDGKRFGIGTGTGDGTWRCTWGGGCASWRRQRADWTTAVRLGRCSDLGSDWVKTPGCGSWWRRWKMKYRIVRCDPLSLTTRFRDRYGDWGRDLALYVGRRRAGLRLRELAAAAGGLDYGRAAGAVQRFGKRLGQDAGLRKLVAKVENEISNS